MRGVGQTTNLIYNLPLGRCILVAPSPDISRQLKSAVEDIRGKEFTKNIKFIVISSSEDCSKLIGSINPIFFDHSFFDLIDEEVASRALDMARSSAIMRINSGR